jgi:hypothetical protein
MIRFFPICSFSFKEFLERNKIGCNRSPIIIGTRYKCLECFDYDFYESCADRQSIYLIENLVFPLSLSFCLNQFYRFFSHDTSRVSLFIKKIFFKNKDLLLLWWLLLVVIQTPIHNLP